MESAIGLVLEEMSKKVGNEPPPKPRAIVAPRMLFPIAVALAALALFGWERYDLWRGNRILGVEASTLEALEQELGAPDEIVQDRDKVCWTYSWGILTAAVRFARRTVAQSITMFR
jgi:hypothetical protein